jgi:malate dehydrogenase (oxaloacetate-decarboxylating)(NADP+)
VKRENVILCDSKGVLHKGRTDGMNPWKDAFASDTRCRTLADAMEGADVFLGGSVKGLVTQRMVQSMAKNPIVFALANPDPEISYPEAKEARPDVLMATGRSDYPNQVNNVLGFPFIFRGALDVRAKAITEEMKLAAARALAALAREPVPDSVSRAYGGERFTFGRDYIIPKPLDPRVLLWVAPAVAEAAIASGVAREKIDIVEYRDRLLKRQSRAHGVMTSIFSKARSRKARIVFPEGNAPKILQAAQQLRESGVCEPILVGEEPEVSRLIQELRLDGLKGVIITTPETGPDSSRYAERYFQLRQRRGITLVEANKRLRQRNYHATLMLECGDADGMVTGLTWSYGESIRAPLEVIRTLPGKRTGGVYIVVLKNDFKLFADCTVNIDPSAEELAQIASQTADLALYFDVTPRVAMLSYSNFGNDNGASPRKVREATELLRSKRPDLEVDGEMQVDPALDAELRREEFPFCRLQDDANVFIFPNLDAANIAYKLVRRLGGAEVIGPVLLGMRKPVNVLQLGASVQEIVALAGVTALQAQNGSGI